MVNKRLHAEDLSDLPLEVAWTLIIENIPKSLKEQNIAEEAKRAMEIHLQGQKDMQEALRNQRAIIQRSPTDVFEMEKRRKIQEKEAR